MTILSSASAARTPSAPPNPRDAWPATADRIEWWPVDDDDPTDHAPADDPAAADLAFWAAQNASHDADDPRDDTISAFAHHAGLIDEALEAAGYIHIKGLPYRLDELDIDPSIGSAAYRLESPAGKVYDVARTPHGPTCDCPDFTFRRDGLDASGCKHIKALRAAGLVAPLAPSPVVIGPAGNRVADEFDAP